MTSKFALVIANTEYLDASFAQLTAPGRDAEEFAQILRELAVFDDVQILLNEGEGKTRRSIARFFAERKRDDLLLLYFSGHGVRNDAGQLFLAANDTEINILEASGIPAEFVTQSMNNSRSQRQLLILDCCNSGAFAHGTKSAATVGKSMGIASAFEGSGFGRVVLTATDATQYAWEGDKVIGDTQKSVFTHFLIEGLKGEADRDGDGRIHVDELYDYAYEQVVRRTPKQTPGKWSYKQQGDIVLRENLRPREVKPAPLPVELLEMLSHPSSTVRKAGIQDLLGLLDGKHQGLARGAEEKLREIASDDDSLTLRRTASEEMKARGFGIELPASYKIPEKKQEEEKRVERSVVKPTRSPELPKPTVEKKPALKRAIPVLKLRTIAMIVGGLAVLTFLAWGGSKLFTALTPTGLPATEEPVATNISSPNETPFAPTSPLRIGSTMTGEDGMILLYVPAGEFTMGSDNGDSDEKPVHKVDQDAYWIDETEVTNEKYALCVSAGKCDAPRDTDRFRNTGYANHPVIYVSWNDATAYCAWAGRRLPTEAEWEKAAIGTGGRIYPWGNETPDTGLLNYNNEIGETTRVGNYPSGASPYGALDMAGNVWEWVADWYGKTYYASLTVSNPSGPNSGQSRVLRGGAWYFGDSSVRSANRGVDDPSYTGNDVGFRCALTADEQTASSISQASETEAVATASLGIGSTMEGEDGMTLLYVPAGEFTMGSADGGDNEKPAHPVYLDAYWIDQTEVTTSMYAQCVQESMCNPPSSITSFTRASYYGDSEFGDYPVIYVSWEDAQSYCSWADRRLPTEAEWEKAARGTNALTYPWGDSRPDSTFLNYYAGDVGDTSKVGSYLKGASPFGALDMAGNVAEWVADLYRDFYYADSPKSNPLGPESGEARVVRGGAWEDATLRCGDFYSTGYVCVNSPSIENYSTWKRDYDGPSVKKQYYGFRCALDATP